MSHYKLNIRGFSGSYSKEEKKKHIYIILKNLEAT